jgi:pimeloyl-ACP methyl ester carboxylesterase
MTAPEPPAWFTRAIAAPFTEHVTEADGLKVHYVRWSGRGSGSPVILIHGGGGHAFWWGFLAPMLADHREVLAIDLTGHGDSGRREHYPREVWVADVVAVIEHAALGAPPVVVGHSMGGFVSIVTAAMAGERLAGAILVDSPVRPPRPADAIASPPPPQPADASPPKARSAGWSFERISPYPDFESAVSRFRLLPEQPTHHPFLLDYVARRSVRQDDDGFTWKFDPRVFEKASVSSLRDYFLGARCRLAIVRGAESVVLPRETAEYMVGLAPGRVPLVEVPEAHHHLMFDQPLSFLVALRALLADWDCSTVLAR